MIQDFLVNNLWVLIAALLVFTMTIAVGFLEVGEFGESFDWSLLKTLFMTGAAVVVMGIVGFNTAFAPTIGQGFIGDPFYRPGFLLGAFSPNVGNPITDIWWSQTPAFETVATGLTTGTYFLFETAFAAVTLALVGVIFLRKVKPLAVGLYSIVYLVVIWNLPAAWIWNPTGWLATMGMVDFAGGLVVHGAAGAAGLGILVRIWQEERRKGFTSSPSPPFKVSSGWLTLAVLLLWVGWFGFNPGSVLAFNDEAIVVVLTTFLAAGAAFLSLMFFRYLQVRSNPGLLWGANGVIMGLIVITPLAGFVSPGSALVLGLFCGPLFLAGEKVMERVKWIADPVGLLPGHLLGGLFGVGMIAFFAQTPYAAGSNATSLPNGLLFGGGGAALHQLGIEALGVVAVMVTVFLLSYVTIWVIGQLIGGITTDYPAANVNPSAPSVRREISRTTEHAD